MAFILEKDSTIKQNIPQKVKKKNQQVKMQTEITVPVCAFQLPKVNMIYCQQQLMHQKKISYKKIHSICLIEQLDVLWQLFMIPYHIHSLLRKSKVNTQKSCPTGYNKRELSQF